VTDTIDLVYAEANYSWSLGRDLGLAVSVQIADQGSVGSTLWTGSTFDTQIRGGEWYER
jgi:hypothetical protein